MLGSSSTLLQRSHVVLYLNNHTFEQATSAITIAKFQLLRSGTDILFIRSSTSLSKQINQSHRHSQDDIQLLFDPAKFSIHIISELWSSTDELSLFGIVAHFFDALYKASHGTVRASADVGKAQ